MYSHFLKFLLIGILLPDLINCSPHGFFLNDKYKGHEVESAPPHGLNSGFFNRGILNYKYEDEARPIFPPHTTDFDKYFNPQQIFPYGIPYTIYVLINGEDTKQKPQDKGQSDAPIKDDSKKDASKNSDSENDEPTKDAPKNKDPKKDAPMENDVTNHESKKN